MAVTAVNKVSINNVSCVCMCVCVYAVVAQVPAVLGLSVLELCMLVAAQRLEDAGSSVFNFQVGGWSRAESW